MNNTTLMQDSPKELDPKFHGVLYCCTAGLLYSFSQDIDPEYVKRWGVTYDPARIASRFFSGDGWKGREKGRSFVAYVPMHSGYTATRKALEDRGWKKIQEYQSDTLHSWRGARYMVGIYFLDAKGNMTPEQIALSEAP